MKDGSGTIHAEDTIAATRLDLDRWMKTLPQPWTAALEALEKRELTQSAQRKRDRETTEELE